MCLSSWERRDYKLASSVARSDRTRSLAKPYRRDASVSPWTRNPPCKPCISGSTTRRGGARRRERRSLRIDGRRRSCPAAYDARLRRDLRRDERPALHVTFPLVPQGTSVACHVGGVAAGEAALHGAAAHTLWGCLPPPSDPRCPHFAPLVGSPCSDERLACGNYDTCVTGSRVVCEHEHGRWADDFGSCPK